jgi:uncharacterized membrane protein SpoIIM required for sporulation
MRVADRVAQREDSWRQLEALVDRMGRKRFRRPDPDDVLRLGHLYREACGDLMLAEAYDLPRETVLYLHGLVGRAYNVLYRARGAHLRDWGRVLFDSAPRQLRSDPAVRLAVLVFVASFLFSGLMAAARPDFASTVVGESFLDQIDEMYDQPIDKPRDKGMGRNDTAMAGFYIQHNTSIGLQCFAWGIFFGIGSLYQLLSNGIVLGTIFGHMAISPHAENFFTFVTAHSTFELPAIMVAGAAGLRMGWGLVDTRGRSRLDSLRREATAALPALSASVVLFVIAAFVEGFVSAAPISYWAKASVAISGLVLIVGFLSLGGRSASMVNDSTSA